MPLPDRKVKKLQELTDEEMDLVNWHLPDVEDDFKTNTGKTTAMGKPLDWYYDKKPHHQEDEEQEEQLQPLTAEEIEEIRQAAYEEGILQGHNDGFEKGHVEGMEKGYADGLEKGKEEGFESGLEQGREAVEQMAARWQSMMAQLNAPLKEVDIEAEQQLVELAVMLAEAVVGVEVKTNREAIFNTLNESVKALPIADGTCEIRVHPDDLELIKQHYSDEQLLENGWQVKSDPTIEIGGCLVESRTSSIDQRLKTRLNNTLERFLQDTGIAEAREKD